MSGLSPYSEGSSGQNNHVFDREADTAPACRIAVGGMMCQESCGSTVKAAIQSVKGVRKVTVSFSDKEARVWGDAAVSLVIDAIESVGFDAALVLDGSVALLDQKRPELVLPIQPAKKEMRNGSHFSKTETANAVPSSSNRSPFLTVMELEIIGMSSSGCVRSIESGLKACMGIQSVRVALIAEEAEIVFDSSLITSGQILDKILIMGYSATVLKRRKLGISGLNLNATLTKVFLWFVMKLYFITSEYSFGLLKEIS
jgi:P-type Cu+ transporter